MAETNDMTPLAQSVARRGRLALTTLALLAGMSGSAWAQTPIKVFAAGSLSGGLNAVAEQYSKETGEPVEFVFGPSGLLLERIEQGEAVDVFASANMAHPQRLVAEGKAIPVMIFVRNSLCALARPDLRLTTDNFLPTLLDPAVNIGTSTPKADPGGDYAWLLFAKAGKIHPGAQQILETKAKQIVGGRASPAVPKGQDPIKYFIAQKKIDLFLGYCSSHQSSPDETLAKVHVPPELAVATDYGVTVLNKHSPAAQAAAFRFALYLLSPQAQHTLANYGFTPVADRLAP
jgi:molybdate transport system substrate-binding protein